VPKDVDHDERRLQIARAATQIISESGVKGLSLRKVASRLGGSSTYVTHYYASKQDLLDDFANQLTEGWGTAVTQIEQGVDDPAERLQKLVQWLLPLDKAGLQEEHARILLLAERDLLGDAARSIFEQFNERIMRFLREHLAQVVPAERVERSAQLLRAVTNGVCLAALERPEAWPASTQTELVDHALALLGISPPWPRRPTRGRATRRRAT
jgi:AcrR family transcriptional regulator